MRNQRMYTELLELLTTDSASGKERQIAEKLRAKMTLLLQAVWTLSLHSISRM